MHKFVTFAKKKKEKKMKINMSKIINIIKSEIIFIIQKIREMLNIAFVN